MLRAFLVSVHETGALHDIIAVLAELDKVYTDCCGVRVGLLANWLRWRNLRGYLELAKRLGLIVMVDNGGFQGSVEPEALARWLRGVQRLVDYVLVPDRPAALCAANGVIDRGCGDGAVEETVRLARRFLELAERYGIDHEKLVPVIQGYDVESYLRCYGELAALLGERLGSTPRLWALGSAKLWGWRSRDRERRGRLRELLAALESRLNGVQLHLLGIHGLDLHRVYYYDIVHSADSGSQGLNYRYKWRTVLGCRRFTAECYRRSVEYEVSLSLAPVRNARLTIE